MNLSLENKRVFVSASTSGIGRSIAETFLKEGSRVMINGRDSAKLTLAGKQLNEKFPDKVASIQGDISTEESCKIAASFAEDIWGGLDVLVANLGSGKPLTKDPLDVSEWNRVMEINLFGPVKLMRTFLPIMGPVSSIVVISSIAGIEKSHAPVPYAAAKAALNIMVKDLSESLGAKGIRINAVAPGNIYFDGGRWDELMREDTKGVLEMINREVPMRRMGSPAEVASAVAFLASYSSSFTTGAVLVVDGGQTRSL